MHTKNKISLSIVKKTASTIWFIIINRLVKNRQKNISKYERSGRVVCVFAQMLMTSHGQ